MATGRVEIVKERCKSCGYCIKFCPKGVLAVGKEVNSKGYEVVYPANPENCIGFISEVFGTKYFSMNFPIMNCNLIRIFSPGLYQTGEERYYRLLLRRQIFCSSAARISSSRKLGWAILIRASALCHVGRPGRLAMPYSVTILGAWVRGVVIISPAVKCWITLECRFPALSVKVECMARKALPCSASSAPVIKSTCPPVPEICLVPADSELT